MTLKKQRIKLTVGVKIPGIFYIKIQKKVIIFASHSFDEDDGSLTVGNTTVYQDQVVKKIEVKMII